MQVPQFSKFVFTLESEGLSFLCGTIRFLRAVRRGLGAPSPAGMMVRLSKSPALGPDDALVEPIDSVPLA
jgi:hypothetical protein